LYEWDPRGLHLGFFVTYKIVAAFFYQKTHSKTHIRHFFKV
jgi:hypothetical protein